MTDRREKILTFFLLVIAGIVAAWIFAFGVRADTLTVKPGESVVSAMNVAKSGDIVYLAKGTHAVSGALVHRSGITITGEPGGGSVLKFVGVAPRTMAYSVEPNASNCVVTMVKIDGSGIWVRGTTNTTILSVEVTNTAQNTAGIWSNQDNTNLRIEKYWPHDFPYWGILLDGHDGGLIVRDCVASRLSQFIHAFTGSNVTVERNTATLLRRMMIELQQRATEPCDTLRVVDNVAWDWYTVYWDSFFLSIMPQTMGHVTVSGNFGRMNVLNGFEVADSSGVNRAGIGIELGFDPRTATVFDNTIASNVKMWTPIISSVDGLRADGTKIYCDAAMYGPFAGESGVNIPGIGDGLGSMLPINTTTGKYAQCPAPPKWATDRMANPAAFIYEQTASGVGGVSAVNPPIVYVTDAGNLVSFSGLQPGDTISIRGNDGKWHIIGDTGGSVLTWAVTPEFDNWIVWAKLDRGPTSSAEVKLPQLHYVAPTSEPTTAELQAKLDKSLSDYAALKIDRDQLKANIDDVTAKVAAKNAALLEAAAKLQEAAK